MSRPLACLISVISCYLPGCQLDGSTAQPGGGPTPRPVEFDRLGIFVGRWEESGTMKMGEKTSKFSGTSTINWEAGQRAIVARGEIMNPDSGEKMQELAIWTWDGRARNYQTFRLSASGEMGHGIATYDESSNSWRYSGKDRNTLTGATTIGEGSVRFADNHTMEWSMTTWNTWKTQKIAEVSGTSRRLP